MRYTSQGVLTGEIHSIPQLTTQPVYDVQLDVYINDEWYASTSPKLNAVFPGHPVPISSFLIPDWDDPSVDPRITSWSFVSTIDYQPITVVSTNLSNRTNAVDVWGEIRNDNPEVIRSIKVVVWSLDGCYSTTPKFAALDKTKLSPGETASFSVTLLWGPYCFMPATTAEVVGQGIIEPSPAP